MKSKLENTLITDVRTVLLTGPCTNDPFLSELRKLRSAAFIEIFTNGPTGIGETYAGYFLPESIPIIVDFFRPILIGQTLQDIPSLWEKMYHCGNFWCRVGLGTAILSGIEAALWDIKGKLLGVPVYELLGGRKHARLPAYATGGPSNYPKDKLARKMDHYLSLGFRGVKIGAGKYLAGESGEKVAVTAAQAADFEADKLTFIREHVGAETWVMLDGHMGNAEYGSLWSVETAIAVAKALEPFDLFFLEEPLHYADPWGYAELCRATTVPIAAGECLTATYEWRVFAGQDSFDIGQPDASWTGGLGEFMAVARMMETHGKKIATHAWGAGGSLMQNVHCGFAAPNTCILEIPPDYAGLHSELVAGSFVMEEGYVLPPERPGLGFVLTEETRRRYPFIPGTGEFNSVPGKPLVT